MTRPPPSPETLARLRRVVGEKGLVAEDEKTPYLVEWRGRYQGTSPLILKPASTDEVAAIVRICAETATAIVPQGGNTGLVGGQIPFGEVLLSLRQMDRIRNIDPLDMTLTAEAGVILADVQKAAREANRLFPLSLAAEGSATLGGNLSTNAGGTNVLAYGNARDLALGLEVVLPDGRIWDGLRRLRKDNTGYDLKQLFIGAEGTLGIITAATVKLFPAPRSIATAFAAVPDAEAAVGLLSFVRERTGNQVTGFELVPRIGLDFVLAHVPDTRDPLASRHDWYVLVELSSGEESGLQDRLAETLAEAIDAGLVRDAVIAQSQREGEALWRLRETLSEVQKHEGGSIKNDISVPISAIPAFLAEATARVLEACPGIRPVPFGHIGDGNVHFNLSQPLLADREEFLARWDEIAHIVNDVAHGLGGSISAEHGLGVMKREEITRYKSPLEIELMRAVKAALDPKNIMNPGKVV